ncbi:MAG: hypothetical protein JNL01_10930 [Bdellovibrionales bacterium]|nr:hypothetical protein [Bdellovibrionales bacterium]
MAMDAALSQEFSKHLSEQKWDAALQLLLKNPRNSADYFFDLGALYSRVDKPGLSYAFFEKARARNPFDSKILAASQQAREKLGALIGEVGVDPVSDPLEAWVDRFPLDGLEAFLGWGFFGILLLLLRWAAKVQWNFKAWIRLQMVSWGLFWGAAYLSVLSLNFWGTRHPVAFIRETVTLRSGPAERFLEISRLPPGTKIRMTGMSDTGPGGPSDSWLQIRFQGRDLAWVPASSLLLL